HYVSVSPSQRLKATTPILCDRERQFLALAPDDAAERVACDAPASVVIDVVRGPVAVAGPGLGGHLLFRRMLPLDPIPSRQRCICKFIISACGIMFAFRLAMITSDPARTRNTMSTPKASASTLLVLSGPVVMWRKNTRCTPIWAMARTASPAGTPGAQIAVVLATQKEVAVRITASSKPVVYTSSPDEAFRSEAGIVGSSPGATSQRVSVMATLPSDRQS